MITSTSYAFIIDTDSYAGNFCREMCAYMTGAIGECGVGQKERKEFFEEMDLSEELYPDETGPFTNLGEMSVSSGVENLIGMQADEHGVRRPCEATINPNWRNNGSGVHARIEEDTPEFSWPAFLSVGIILNFEPMQSTIDIMKDRAYKFAVINKFQIEGFRLVTVMTVETSKNI